MHFLFFAAQYLPTVGGVERYTHNLAKTLVEQGHEATVATSLLPGLPQQETTPEGIRVVRLPSHLFMKGRFPFLRHGGALRRAAAPLWETPVHMAVVNTHFYSLSVWAARQCKKRGVPALVLEHGTKHLSLDSRFLNFFGNGYEHAAMRLIRRSRPGFYGVSRACGEWLAHFGVQAQGVLYNAVNQAALQRMAEQCDCDFRARFGLEPGAPLIVFSGRFIREKGLWELLDGFAALRETHPAARLVLAGDGPLYGRVHAQRRPGVHLAGLLPYEESIALLHQCDVFCLPTYSEGFSSVVLEAAAVGACIITTPTGGSPELISDGESGILLQELSAGAVADALRRALADEAFRRAAGRAVRQTVKARFTWESTAASLAALASEVAQ